MTARGVLLGPVIAAAGILAVVGGPVAHAQEKAPAEEAAEGPQKAATWSVNCADAGAGLACKATQSIVLAKTRQLVLAVSVSKADDKGSAPMLLQLPHGLFNPAGVTVGVDDGKPDSLEIQTCDVKGCYAGTALTPEKLGAMTKGAKLNVVFETLKRQKITVPVPLAGFEVAYKKL